MEVILTLLIAAVLNGAVAFIDEMISALLSTLYTACHFLIVMSPT